LAPSAVVGEAIAEILGKTRDDEDFIYGVLLRESRNGVAEEMADELGGFGRLGRL
jgi:hypothetical protein